LTHFSEKSDRPGPVAGRRANVLSVTSLVMVGLFTLAIMALVVADILYVFRGPVPAREVFSRFATAQVGRAVGLSLATSFTTLGLVIVFSVPIGYALSRYRFPGHAFINTIVDAPIVLPPVIVGVSLLAFFGTRLGGMIKDALSLGGWSLDSAIGIVLCQFLISVSYSIRSCAAAFDSVGRELEGVALTLGCTQWQTFRRVTLPLARSGLLAGCVMAWARALGIFGPLMVFVGTSPRVLVMPTAIYRELNSGDIAVALAIALVMLLLAGGALVIVHRLETRVRWWAR
jgi:molybdate transport system permease protein